MTFCGIAERPHLVVRVHFGQWLQERAPGEPESVLPRMFLWTCVPTIRHHPMTSAFYSGIPVFRGFTSLMDPALYSPLPDDWSVGVADIVDSTKAIASQRYKAVNMAGAAVIAAVTNVLEGREFPFVFGGDGASFAVAPDDLELAREALAATATWVREDLDLRMRVALVPVSAIRAQGLDVRVARFGPSATLAYAISCGGGLAWADSAMKRGEFAITEAPAG